MINAIYGKKVGMTQLFDEDGKIIPVTVIEAAPNKVCQIKTTDTDGYEAVQLGFGTIKENKVNKPMAGHFAKLGTEPVRYLREVRVEDASEHTVGEEVTVIQAQRCAYISCHYRPPPNNALYFSSSSSTASSMLAFKNIFSDSDKPASLSQSKPFCK